jgi:diguanylate cyclase (GGDEF)-like protein
MNQHTRLAPAPKPEHVSAVRPVSAEQAKLENVARRQQGLQRRVIRNGIAVVGGSIIASLLLTHLSFTFFGDADYTGTMIAAFLIPLLVAGTAYGWIALLTMRLDQSNAALDHLAHCDPLTGIANRRRAMTTLDSWTTGEQRTGQCCLAIADIDLFKRINDRFGHDVGDAGIVHVAHMLGSLAPAPWLVARIGGEEFLIAAPDACPDDFANRIEELRAAIADTPLITNAGPHELTVSFGMAQWEPGEPITRLMSRADKALYRAKQAGRNRVEMAA